MKVDFSKYLYRPFTDLHHRKWKGNQSRRNTIVNVCFLYSILKKMAFSSSFHNYLFISFFVQDDFKKLCEI